MAEDNQDIKNIIGNIFGWIGTVVTIYFFSAPAVPFYKLIRGQIKINDAPGILLIFSFLNCILWFNYGLLCDKPQMYYTNGIGSALTLIFITIFLAYFSKQKIYLTTIFLLCLIIVMGVISYLCYYIIYYKYVGYGANGFNVCMYAATGEKIYRVFKTKNYNLMPIFSLIGGFISASCWIIYGSLIYDINVLIPNGLGVLFSIIQLVVYFYLYYQKKKEGKLIDTNGNEDTLI